jgi:hypothetical protein
MIYCIGKYSQNQGIKGIGDRAKFVKIAPGRYELIATTQAAQVQLAQ